MGTVDNNDSASFVLNPDRLCRAAEQDTGLSQWGEPPFREALERLCRSAVHEAGLEGAGLQSFANMIGTQLNKRLALYADRARYPEIALQRVESPLVVLGLPRSGTTILHALLAQDPDLRSPQRWEVEEPSPPPETATYTSDPRIAHAQAVIDRIPAELRAMHAMGATLPEECNAIMGMAFLSPNFGAFARLPSYMRWLVNEADMTSAFTLHRHVLQHLQAFAPGAAWVLKSPPYLLWLDALMATYPDARLIFTHRDPAETLPSNCSLIAFLRNCNTMERKREVGAEGLFIWRTGIERLLAWRADRDGASFADVHYRDFLHGPMEIVRSIYQQFGMTLSAEAQRRMAAFLADNQQNKHGQHIYAASDYGLDPDMLRTVFADYIDTIVNHRR